VEHRRDHQEIAGAAGDLAERQTQRRQRQLPTANLSPEDAGTFAAIVSAVSKRRSLTTIGLLMDERFARATGGQLLVWQPATGEVAQRSTWRFW
jgi:hypothetical protein